MKYLLDTKVISELVAKQPNPGVIQWVDNLEPGSEYLSVVTIGEIRKGIEKLPASSYKETLRNWLNDELLARFNGRILVLDVPVMLLWGELTGRLERLGRPLSALDSLIAALALYHNCIVVTRNESDFNDSGVTIINPWA
jgi:toxin FitB